MINKNMVAVVWILNVPKGSCVKGLLPKMLGSLEGVDLLAGRT